MMMLLPSVASMPGVTSWLPRFRGDDSRGTFSINRRTCFASGPYSFPTPAGAVLILLSGAATDTAGAFDSAIAQDRHGRLDP